MKQLLFALAILITTAGYAQKPVTYLALGDSYTIGEAVSQKESFPYQLSALLNKQNIKVGNPRIVARTGWTTDELQAAIAKENIKEKFDFVTLLIGVNNQFRGYPEAIFRKEFIELLNASIKFANGKKNRVFVVSIPDWGATPYAAGADRAKIGGEIDRFNAICKAESLKAGIKYIDITPGSRKALNDKALVAGDGLHPSGKMYANWVQQLAAPVAVSLK
jgi:lysophospholipase L1-like esterase